MPFSLNLTGIYFEGSLPRYPSLVHEHLREGLQLEPAIKGPRGGRPGETFEVFFRLDPAQTVRFLTLPDGEVPLSRVDGRMIGSQEGWIADAEDDALVCRLQWTRPETPATQVVRIGCVRGHEILHLLFSWVRPFEFFPRVTFEQRPVPGVELPQLVVTEIAEELVYEIFTEEARFQLPEGMQFEPALRVRPGEELQFEIQLTLATGLSFAPDSTGTDEVPVSYGREGTDGSALMPTLRPEPGRCTVTWKTSAQHPAPAGGFLVFNLEMKAAGSPREFRVDPTIIEDPYLPPPQGGGS